MWLTSSFLAHIWQIFKSSVHSLFCALALSVPQVSPTLAMWAELVVIFLLFPSTIDLHNRTWITLFRGYLLICLLHRTMGVSQTWTSYNLHFILSSTYSNNLELHFNLKVIFSKYCLNSLEVGIECFRNPKQTFLMWSLMYICVCAFTSAR